MRTILSAALVLGFCGLAAAQGEKADPVGTWKCEYEIGGQKRTSTLTIKKDGDKLAGTMTWPDQKETNVKDVKLKGSELTFSAVRVFMDNKIPIDYKFTIAGDKLKGKGEAEIGGQKQEFDIEAKREKVEKAEKVEPVGTWKLEYEINGQKRTAELTIKKDGDKLAGTMTWPDQKEAKLKDVKLKDRELTFSAVREIADNKLNVEYKLAITGDKLKGKGAVETGGEKREFDIDGKREKKDK
ncbi:MAG: hypothetical protein U0746_08295 [Gemmataceae bacterium]